MLCIKIFQLEEINLLKDTTPLKIQFCQTSENIFFITRIFYKETFLFIADRPFHGTAWFCLHGMNYRTRFQGESLRAENIFFLSWLDIENDFVPIRSRLITILRKFRVVAFWRFRTGRGTIPLLESVPGAEAKIGNTEEFARSNAPSRTPHINRNSFSSSTFGAICFNVLEARPNGKYKFWRIIWKIDNYLVTHNCLHYILCHVE